MQIINVGPDENDPDSSCVPTDADLVVYSYEEGSYEGNGEAYARANGKWYTASLGHCSCYGAWDDDWNGIPRSWEQITYEEMMSIHLQDGNPIKKAILKYENI